VETEQNGDLALGMEVAISQHEAQELNAFALFQASKKQYGAAALAFYGLHVANPRFPDYLCQAATNLRLAGQYSQADQLFIYLLEKYEKRYSHFMEAGLCKLELREFDSACTYFSTAYSLNKTEHAAVWSGVALRRAGRFTPALQQFEIALQHNPQSVAARIEMAGCYEGLKEFDRATELYSALLDDDQIGSQPFLFNRLGLCLEKEDHRDRLSNLLDSERYYQNLDAAYAVVSTILWGLRLNKGLKDELLLPFIAKFFHERAVIDAVTLYLTSKLCNSRSYCRNYRSIIASDPYGADALKILDVYTLDSIQSILTTVKFKSVEEGIDVICDKIESGTPFSLVRLGDGEGNFLASRLNPNSIFLAAQNQRILRNWFGDGVKHIDVYSRLAADVSDAVEGADLVGVPNSSRILYELTNDPRGYWGVYFSAYYAAMKVSEKEFISPNVHLHIFQSEKFISALRSTQSVNTITCHRGFGPLLRANIGVTRGVDLIVPGEMGVPEMTAECKQGDHYPETYSAIISSITGFEPGSIVLVAAGICGKAYVNFAKRAGCVGLDIGAIVDYFMGVKTRKIFYDSNFQASHHRVLQEHGNRGELR
jgi:tetratricopeptide (TPR) repeat protein